MSKLRLFSILLIIVLFYFARDFIRFREDLRKADAERARIEREMDDARQHPEKNSVEIIRHPDTGR